jgi:hypothetical protein
MRLYQAVDKLDGADSYWLVYPNGEVAVLYVRGLVAEDVRYSARYYARSKPERFNDAINPVLVKEWV